MAQAQAADRRSNKNEKKDELVEKLVHINRVAKTVKGGRNMSFAAVVVVGDLREAHERRAGACGNQVLAVGVAAAWRVDGKVALAAKVNTAQGGGGFHHKPFARPTGSGDGRA